MTTVYNYYSWSIYRYCGALGRQHVLCFPEHNFRFLGNKYEIMKLG